MIFVLIKKEQVFQLSCEPCESAAQGKERGREKEKRVQREGKVRGGKKVEKENRECTCNLTVMKGTPRKECNKTKVKWVRLEGGGLQEKRGKRSWISSWLPENAPVFLPVRQAPWNEKAKQTCSPRLYLVNHQHYKPVLQALWGREEEETERKKERKSGGEKRLAQKIQAGRKKSCEKLQYLIKSFQIQNQLLRSSEFVLKSSKHFVLVYLVPLLHSAGCSGSLQRFRLPTLSACWKWGVIR